MTRLLTPVKACPSGSTNAKRAISRGGAGFSCQAASGSDDAGHARTPPPQAARVARAAWVEQRAAAAATPTRGDASDRFDLRPEIANRLPAALWTLLQQRRSKSEILD